MTIAKPISQKRFDLFWLMEPQIRSLCTGNLHHGPMDSSKRTNTGINVFQQCGAISGCIGKLDKKWAQEILTKMQADGRSTLNLSEEFLTICKENNITIPFSEIDSDSYDNNIERRLQRSISPEGNSRSVEG